MIKTSNAKRKALTRRGQSHFMKREGMARKEGAGMAASCPALLRALLASAGAPAAGQACQPKDR